MLNKKPILNLLVDSVDDDPLVHVESTKYTDWNVTSMQIITV